MCIKCETPGGMFEPPGSFKTGVGRGCTGACFQVLGDPNGN